MKFIIWLCIAFILTASILPQDKYAGRLPKNRTDLKITKVTDEVYKFEDSLGQFKLRNIGNFITSKNSLNYDSTIININSVDTLPYYNKYKFWREIPISNHSSHTLVIKDANRNNYPELYGTRILFNSTFDTIPLRIYEYSPQDSNFHNLYTFPNSIIYAREIYDVNKDGKYEFFTSNNYNSDLNVFRANEVNNFPTLPDFNFDGHFQMNDIAFSDFDNDGINEMIYFSFTPNKTVIMKYNHFINNFDSLYTLSVTDLYSGGYSFSDIDNDGYNTIILGTDEGNVHAIKFEPGSGYKNIWNGKVETFNAYLHLATKDIDGNGKNEFWVGGAAFYDGVPITRLTCFETDKEQKYKPVTRIDIVGIFSFDASNIFALDVDKCGKEEICLCLANYFMILKFTGSPNHHSYQIYYIKKNDMPEDENNASDYYGTVMSDLDNDSEHEIIISLEQRVYDQNHNVKYRAFSRIYKKNTSSSVIENKNIKKDFNISQNYPNPFNPSTNIDLNLPERSPVSIKIYNVVGECIRELCNQEMDAGNHTMEWDGKGQNGKVLSSGVYLIQVKTNNQSKIIKSLLLK